MAKYTIELRELFEPLKFNPPIYTRNEVESFFKDYELENYLTGNQIDTIMSANIWSKEKLARKIVDHYYMREIGFETIGLFKLKAKITMEELMEEYLPLIYSASISYDPLVNVDYTETYSRQVDDTGSSTTNGTVSTTASDETTNSASGLTINSDTPQGQINKTDILAGNYASSTQAGESSNSTETESSNSSETENTNESESQTIESSTRHMVGNSGVSATAQKMIEQYRANIRAIDREIINKLNTLFIGLY